MKKPVFEIETIVVRRLLKKIPDGRTRSGYKEPQLIATSQTYIPDHIDGSELAMDQLVQVGKKRIKVSAYATVQFANRQFRTEEV